MNGRLKPFLICLFTLVLATHAFAEVNLPSLVKKIQPAVVTVLTYDKDKKPLKLGSGFFINHKGHLITNYHVLAGAYQAEVKTQDGKKYLITSVIAENKAMDLIKISADIPRGSVQWINVTGALPAIAERIVVIGSPMGLAQTISEGIVSGVREIPNRGEILQVSAPISTGSSGSPVVNMNGQVVGVATFYLLKGQSLNFAIPAQFLIDLKSVGTHKTLSEWAYVTSQKSVIKKAQQSRLFVQTEPEGARIRILNIKPKFNQGIILKSGRYHVEVGADGYEMEKVWIKIESGKDKNLQISLKKMPQLLTKDPDDLITIGIAHGKKGDLKKAIKAFKQAIHINPDDAAAYYNLGIAYSKFGRYKEAVEVSKQAIRIVPDAANAHELLGVAYGRLGRYKEAVDAHKQAIRINPDYATAYYNLGVVYRKLGRYREAVDACKQAIRIEPDYADAHFTLGIVYHNLGRYREAIGAYKQAIHINPDDAAAYYNLGVAYGRLGRYKEAVDAHKQAIRINPDYATAHYNLGLIYLILGDNGSALEQYKILKTLDKGLANKLFNLIYK